MLDAFVYENDTHRKKLVTSVVGKIGVLLFTGYENVPDKDAPSISARAGGGSFTANEKVPEQRGSGKEWLVHL